MRQQFTVELESIPILRASILVTATDVEDARRQALGKASRDRSVWTVEDGAPLVRKITAHSPIKAVGP